jgi:hypothetical protein
MRKVMEGAYFILYFAVAAEEDQKYEISRSSFEGRPSLIRNSIASYATTKGRAIAQALSRWIPTAAVRGSSPGLVMWDFVVDKVVLG